MTLIRLIAVFATVGVLAGEAWATQPSNPVPVPPSRPVAKSAKASVKPTKATIKPAKANSKPAKVAKGAAPKTTARKGSTAPVVLAPAAITATAAIGTAAPSRMTPAAASPRSAPPFVMAASGTTPPMDLSALKEALDLVHKGRFDEATNLEGTIGDPLARKLLEWIILRNDNSSVDFSRYAAFIAANPSWPSIVTLRRHAEVALWQQHADPQTVIGFFGDEMPLTAKGAFALARAWLVRGEAGRAEAVLRTAWRNYGLSEDLETQGRAGFDGLIMAADDKVRMDARLYAEDTDAGMRAARRLDDNELAIARARIAVIDKSANAKALLDAVPAAAQHDPGYMFSRIQWLRRGDRIKEAAEWMLAAPHDPEKLVDLDQWWVERRLIARKLLDLGEARTAYEIASGGAPPPTENYRAEQQFTAGWIALRFLREPTIALEHFARIADGVVNPITLARSFYWQGRAAEAMGREREARTHYETAARYPTAYYGELARARLNLDEVTLRELPPPPAEHHALELARAFEILYALDERNLVATMAADLGDKATDAAALAALAEITARHNDARATLLIGKTALGHGLPLEHYAFPDFGVPNFQQIGPQVERCVIYSIVRQESAFNPRDVSSANALGLMQVTPAAGRDTARRFKVPFDQRRLMADVVYNAQLGTAELGNDIASWRGSYILAFVAYNAGPRRAKEWIEQYGDPRDRKVDPVDWIERIPIAETRNYVQRVLENMQVYRARLENNSRLLIEADLRRGG